MLSKSFFWGQPSYQNVCLHCPDKTASDRISCLLSCNPWLLGQAVYAASVCLLRAYSVSLYYNVGITMNFVRNQLIRIGQSRLFTCYDFFDITPLVVLLRGQATPIPITEYY